MCRRASPSSRACTGRASPATSSRASSARAGRSCSRTPDRASRFTLARGMARLAVIVRGERVSLVAPAREPFVDRWVEMNDPELGMALGAATSTLSPTARVMPPISREQREALYEAHVARELLVFELWLADGERCVGEAYLAGIAWPRGGADVTVALYSPDDRGQGLGTEAGALL